MNDREQREENNVKQTRRITAVGFQEGGRASPSSGLAGVVRLSLHNRGIQPRRRLDVAQLQESNWNRRSIELIYI